MRKQAYHQSNGRRIFVRNLFGLGIGAALVRYAGATPPQTPAESTAAAPASVPPATGYRLTPHIERYYRSARR